VPLQELGVGVWGYGRGLDAWGFRGRARARLFMFDRGAYEGGEERVRFEGLGFKFWVKLAA